MVLHIIELWISDMITMIHSMMAATVGRREESMEGKERKVGNKKEKLLVNAE